jgi:8-oxo-dGTP diphosphatase
MVVDVTCAIIEHQGKVLGVQRGEHMSLAYKWEFPGGKVEPGETYRECLARELVEELNVEVNIYDELEYCDQPYPERIIRLIPFICEISGGYFTLTEHHAHKWLEPHELHTLDWAPADLKVIDNYLKFITERVK